MQQHLVIIGGGQAAAQAVHTSRQAGFAGRISVIADEHYLPYQRPPLSKQYLAGEYPRERLLLKTDSYYRDRSVDMLLGATVVEIDVRTQNLRLHDDRRIAYDRLLLATGSRVRRLSSHGDHLDGIYYLRTIDDVDALSARLAASSRLIIVGGGYIGLEAAAVCAVRGLDVTVLEASSRILNRVVAETTADFFHRRHEAAGVKIRCEAHVSEFVGSEAVSAVRTVGGDEYACDCVLVAIGIQPNVELAEGAGLDCDNGVLVDEFGTTADANIAAAGDCTNQPHPWVGSRVRLESVHNAIGQSKAAMLSLLGQREAFTAVPWFWSDQYKDKLQIVGLAHDYDETVVRGDPNSSTFAVYYRRNGHLIAVDSINRPMDFVGAKKLLAAHADPPAEAIADPAVDLAQFAAN